MTHVTRWFSQRDGDMVEGALTLPLMALLALALLNLALAGYASNTATNAADYAARIGAVSQTNANGRAMTALNNSLSTGPGTYDVDVQADVPPGSYVTVRVRWEVPNVYGGLMSLFGASSGELSGEAVATQRKEGW